MSNNILTTQQNIQYIGAQTEGTLFCRLVQLRVQEDKSLSWVLLGVVTGKYYEGTKLKTIVDKDSLIDTLKKQISQVNQIEVLVESVLLKSLIEEKYIIIGKIDLINEALSNIITLKIQLPSVFGQDDQIELELLSFKFDPQSRLTQFKENQFYSFQNVGKILSVLQEQNRRAWKLYDSKDWKNSLRLGQIFCFQLELVTKVIKVQTPSFALKPLSVRHTPRFKTLRILIDSQTEQILITSIKLIANELLEDSKRKQSVHNQLLVSLVPQKIFNPHIFIKTASKQKYLQYFTKGVYEYYHYGDQNFNDQGWGCAYRSLQTLLSWLNSQNYCKLPKMLTITQIQQLIDRINLGSKQKLRDTRQWIGATEVSWVVKKLTDFDCRIVHISDGNHIIENCQIFRQHFQKVGCPIMYGGGEYAYSIVGINYSWKLGQCQFLILDPHYTGSDLLDKIIEKKGLCWRKPQEMFKKGIFYNFCLPLI